MSAAESTTQGPAAARWALKEETLGAAVVFAGRAAPPGWTCDMSLWPGPEGSREAVLARLTGEKRQVAWARQVHSARVLTARPGECGEGDALVTRGSGVALSIVTADCVPVLLAGPTAIAAAHAGWRGIVAGVVGAAVEAMAEDPASLRAWIGPAIGPCCYETGPDVAAQVAAASDPAIVAAGPAGRPHLDLQRAVRHQLQAAGLDKIQAVPLCTRCETQALHSYRRDGRAAGRNHAFIWRI